MNLDDSFVMYMGNLDFLLKEFLENDHFCNVMEIWGENINISYYDNDYLINKYNKEILCI